MTKNDEKRKKEISSNFENNIINRILDDIEHEKSYELHSKALGMRHTKSGGRAHSKAHSHAKSSTHSKRK